MIFYLHYILLTSGLSGTGVLLGVFFKFYSDASQAEIGALLMSFPFSSLIIKPLFCSIADKRQAHRVFLIWSLVVLIAGYLPFIAIPYFPDFYSQHPRIVWYMLVVSCFVGNSGLAVAWSLGDSLAVNIAAKRGQSFGRYRLFGTVSWGVYGYIIGQINEHPAMPKYTPSFVILVVSVVIEILFLIFWNNEDFIMFDADQQKEQIQEKSKASAGEYQQAQPPMHLPNFEQDWTPSSVGGSLRMSPQVARALRELVTADEQQAQKIHDLENGDTTTNSEKANIATIKLALASTLNQPTPQQTSTDKRVLEIEYQRQAARDEEDKNRQETRNPQIILFRMIMKQDGRLIKYMVFAFIIGYLLSIMNFLFISLEEVAVAKGHNFSNLAGAVLISQAGIETLGFLAQPFLIKKFSRTALLSCVLFILVARYIFYSFFYYTSDISPYWALVGEWGHGIAYALSCTILADVALLFANQCKFFIPEMKQMGFLKESDDKKKVQEEEDKIRMALRASMQAIFGGLMDGGGNGVGCLVCGILVEAFNFITLWRSMAVVASATVVVLIVNELAKTKYSDRYKPKPGTKAFEIRSISA